MLEKTERFEFRTSKELAERLKTQKNVSAFVREAITEKLGDFENGK